MKNHPKTIEALKLALVEMSKKSDEELSDIFSRSVGDVGQFIMDTSQTEEINDETDGT